MRTSKTQIRTLRYICRALTEVTVSHLPLKRTVGALVRRNLIVIENGVITPTAMGQTVYESVVSVPLDMIRRNITVRVAGGY